MECCTVYISGLDIINGGAARSPVRNTTRSVLVITKVFCESIIIVLGDVMDRAFIAGSIIYNIFLIVFAHVARNPV